ncbi:MAG: terminase family protein [Bryobacteraceae bacterium]|nr:terminase family protein [Bryobacteraceae bacterium]
MGGTKGRVLERAIEYSPLPSQARFHASQARFKGFSGPVGSGKSQALCQEAIRLSYVNAGRWGLLGAPTYPMLREATQSTLFEILAKNQIPYEHHKGENVLVMKDTGSRIIFRPLDDYERLRGTNLAWFGLDELTYTAEEAWLRLEGRLRDPKAKRLCGFAVWTPKGFDWVYRRFIEKPVEGYETILAQPYENRYLLEKVPDYYERLQRSYDGKFFEQEVLGKYLNVSEGQVYHCFDRKRNVAECTIDPGLPLRWSLDFNVDPMCSVVAQIREGVVQVVDELVLGRSSTPEVCEEFVKRHGRHPSGVVIYGDASGSRRQSTGWSDYAMIRQVLTKWDMKKVSYRIASANPEVRERVNLVNAMLKSAGGEARLFIDRKCQELIADLEQVSYKPGSSEIDKERDPRRTHLSDALGYLIWQECRPMAPVGGRGKRIL